MMDRAYMEALVAALRGRVTFEAGLTDAEVDAAERRYGIRFPPDLRALLQFALPVSAEFPNWRTGVEGGSTLTIEESLRWPAEGIAFDVEQGRWNAAWGSVEQAPKLVPVCGHRFLPCEPFEAGNPVFSVYQTDVIVVGNDLADYFAEEFGAPRPAWAATTARRIRFWSDLAES